jgi:hypothetical protein
MPGRCDHATPRSLFVQPSIDARPAHLYGRLLRASPGARAYYDKLRARGKGHITALRQLGNRLIGILHGCPETGTCYGEHTAGAHNSSTFHPAAT